MVSFFKKTYAPEAYERLARVINSGFLTTGEVAKGVEKQIEEYFNVDGATLCNSWTSCWELVLAFHDIGPGDEVVMPSMTFVSCANAVIRRGAKVVFCDISTNELNATVETILPCISQNTKIILVVHLYGLMANVKSISNNFPKIAIYEDAAHCFEGSRDDMQPGSCSNGAMFSFYATKNISCGEGGALISNDKNLIEYAKTQRLHGMSKSAIDRYTSTSYVHWDVEDPGFKFNLPDVLAALLPEQISNSSQKIRERARVYKIYIDLMANLLEQGQVRVQAIPEKATHAHHLFAIAVDNALRDRLLKYFGARGIGVAVNFRDIPSLSYYADYDRPINAADWGKSTISLPFYPEISETDIKETVDVLLDFFRNEVN